jgi:integrase
MVLARAGCKVDLSGDVWTVLDPNGNKLIDWRSVVVRTPEILETFKEYVEARIPKQAPPTVLGDFDAMRVAVETRAFQEADRACSASPTHVLGSDILREMIGAGIDRTRLTRWRYFYVWACREANLDGRPARHFSEAVSREMYAVPIGANGQAEVVLDLDPNQGPLLDAELYDLIDALSGRGVEEILTLQERTAIWLALSLGGNASHSSQLRVSDFEVVPTLDGEELYKLRIPRIKKRDSAAARSHFRTRRLNHKIGRIVQALVRERMADPRCAEWIERDWGIPIFLRREPDLELAKSQISEYVLHMRSGEFSTFLREAVAKLGIESPRTGEPLRVFPRRLRHTFGTNAAVRGAPPAAIAEALDHSTLNTVMVYVDNRRVLAERIDQALDATMGKVVRAFRGRVVQSEKEVHASSPTADRIYVFDEASEQAKAIGSCAASTACDLQPPLSCYTCAAFRPWRSADHRAVLASLRADRDHRNSMGLADRMVRMHDRTIDAVEAVIREVDFELRRSAKAPPRPGGRPTPAGASVGPVGEEAAQ